MPVIFNFWWIFVAYRMSIIVWKLTFKQKIISDRFLFWIKLSWPRYDFHGQVGRVITTGSIIAEPVLNISCVSIGGNASRRQDLQQKFAPAHHTLVTCWTMLVQQSMLLAVSWASVQNTASQNCQQQNRNRGVHVYVTPTCSSVSGMHTEQDRRKTTQ